MLRSPAYQALSLSARRVIELIEIELAHHGGTDNGKLPVTYGNFHDYRIDRQAIAPAIREAVALGFVEITERGRPSKADFGRHPNLFRLTYRHGARKEEPTHEWRRLTSFEQATAAAKTARAAKDEKAVAKSKANQKENPVAGGGGTSRSGGEDHPVSEPPPRGKNHPTVIGWEDHRTLDISGEGSRKRSKEKPERDCAKQETPGGPSEARKTNTPKGSLQAPTAMDQTAPDSAVPDNLFRTIDKPKPKSAAEKLRAPPPSEPEVELFRRGKEVLGPAAGGMIARLLKAKGRPELARAAIEMASVKENPREYIGAIIRGIEQPHGSSII